MNGNQQFIVRLPSGRKSKPASRQQIAEMHLMGKIPNGAVVVELGKENAIPVDEFITSKSDVRDSTPSALNTELPGQDHDPLMSVGTSTFRPYSPPVKQRDLSVIDTMHDCVMAVLRWPFRGLIIPTRGADETRDYLRRNLVWIEVVLFMMHVCTLFVLFFLGFGFFSLIVQSVGRVGKDIDVLQLLLMFTGSMYLYLFLFIGLMIAEAFLRVIPAAMRYWIEVMEENRMTDGKRRGVDG